MTAPDTEFHPCECGCGTLVRLRFKRGHSSRTRRYAQTPEGAPVIPLPGPDEIDDGGVEDFPVTIDIDSDSSPRVTGDTGPAPVGDLPGAGPAGDDQPPAHARRGPRARRRRDEDRGAPRTPGTPKAPPRVTQGIKRDIDAKISFALEIPGRIWQARDPLCGTVFVEQRAEISGALTEIICQSADLIAWFAGSGGQFMLWLNLAAACWPVATVAMAHHVYHSAGEAPPGAGQVPPRPGQDYSRYAA